MYADYSEFLLSDFLDPYDGTATVTWQCWNTMKQLTFLSNWEKCIIFYQSPLSYSLVVCNFINVLVFAARVAKNCQLLHFQLSIDAQTYKILSFDSFTYFD